MKTVRSPEGCALLVDDVELRVLFHGLEYTLADMRDAAKKAAFIELFGIADYEIAHARVTSLIAKLAVA